MSTPIQRPIDEMTKAELEAFGRKLEPPIELDRRETAVVMRQALQDHLDEIGHPGPAPSVPSASVVWVWCAVCDRAVDSVDDEMEKKVYVSCHGQRQGVPKVFKATEADPMAQRLLAFANV